jgi:hypothetical protein
MVFLSTKAPVHMALFEKTNLTKSAVPCNGSPLISAKDNEENANSKHALAFLLFYFTQIGPQWHLTCIVEGELIGVKMKNFIIAAIIGFSTFAQASNEAAFCRLPRGGGSADESTSIRLEKNVMEIWMTKGMKPFALTGPMKITSVTKDSSSGAWVYSSKDKNARISLLSHADKDNLGEYKTVISAKFIDSKSNQEVTFNRVFTCLTTDPNPPWLCRGTACGSNEPAPVQAGVR